MFSGKYYNNNKIFNNSFTNPYGNTTLHNYHQPMEGLVEHINKHIIKNLETSACFILRLDSDRSEHLVTLPQNSTVRDLYDLVNTKFEEISAPKGIYIDQKCKIYINNCKETLIKLVKYYELKSITPDDYTYQIFKLYISTGAQK